MNKPISFENAQWIKALGYSKKNRTNGYATKSFEIVTHTDTSRGTYHNCHIGELVNEANVSISKNFKDTIAAPTCSEAIEFLNNTKIVRVDQATTEKTKTFFKLVIINSLVLLETKPAENVHDAVEKMLSDKAFRAAVEKRVFMQ